jgi:hypothetical protein
VTVDDDELTTSIVNGTFQVGRRLPSCVAAGSKAVWLGGTTYTKDFGWTAVANVCFESICDVMFALMIGMFSIG